MLKFVNYIQRLNLNEDQLKNLSKTDLIEKILSEYIGKKVMTLEIEKLGITITDNALRNIIKNDQQFSKDGKFSRTEYEKFLITSKLTAPFFETNMAEQEKETNKTQPRVYTINSEQLMDIMRYLMTRPYGEVVKLMNSMSTLTPTSGSGTNDRKK